MEASVYYMIRFSISPQGQGFIDWLYSGHIAEVVEEPGFLWARHYRLDVTDEDGWAGHLSIYGLDSVASLQAYFASARREHFVRQSERFQDVQRAERFFGSPEPGVGRGAPVGDADLLCCERFTVPENEKRAFVGWLGRRGWGVPGETTFASVRCIRRLDVKSDGQQRYVVISRSGGGQREPLLLDREAGGAETTTLLGYRTDQWYGRLEKSIGGE